MSELTQVEVETLTLKLLFDLANQGTSWIDATYVAGTLQKDISVPRAEMALRTLTITNLIRARYVSRQSPKYEITEEGYKKVEELLAGERGSLEGSESDIPASDRIVGFDHNSRSYMEARAEVDKLRRQIESANDLGDLTPRAAKVAAVEVGLLGSTLDEEYFRPKELWSRVKMTLSWIGREAAGAVVGTLALGLLALLAALLGFPLV